MFAYIKGNFEEKGNNYVVIDVGGVGYKIFTNLSGQEHCLMTNNINITSFDDLIGSKYQIALVNVGSFRDMILIF